MGKGSSKSPVSPFVINVNLAKVECDKNFEHFMLPRSQLPVPLPACGGGGFEIACCACRRDLCLSFREGVATRTISSLPRLCSSFREGVAARTVTSIARTTMWPVVEI